MAFKAAKVTLGSGKIVIIREMKISHTELAAQEVAPKAAGDANVLQVLMQKALVKNLLVEINGQPVTAQDREKMDDLFSMAEYTQLLTVIKEMSGGDDMGKMSQIEAVSYGDK